MEEKAVQIKSPSNYLKAAAAREGSAAVVSVQTDESKIHRRATWLSSNVFQDRPISEEAVAALMGLGTRRALELFKDIEEKQDQIKNPSGYLISAASRETAGAHPGPAMMALPAITMPVMRSTPAPVAAMAMSSSADEAKIWRRASWLNANVFPDRPIDDEAIAAMSGLGAARAMELFKDVEEKQGQVRSPSGYLKTAASRESSVNVSSFSPRVHVMQPMQVTDATKVQRRASWLNANVFPDRPIDHQAIEAMMNLGTARAMELFKDSDSDAILVPPLC
ncbi:FTSH10 [Symbiodinium natans]|uniref:FTSH10 protein n=1 Tax=Symbiodinium natans TaxID=878477 RepID=A0A812V9C7_9DINO|nr:FTSH10 [Symbiodinium natans]